MLPAGRSGRLRALTPEASEAGEKPPGDRREERLRVNPSLGTRPIANMRVRAARSRGILSVRAAVAGGWGNSSGRGLCACPGGRAGFPLPGGRREQVMWEPAGVFAGYTERGPEVEEPRAAAQELRATPLQCLSTMIQIADVCRSSSIKSMEVLGRLRRATMEKSWMLWNFVERWLIALASWSWALCQQPSSSRLYVPMPTGIPHENIFIRTKDGVRLNLILIRYTGDNSPYSPTIIYFHGNAGNIGHRLPNALLMLVNLKVNLLLVDYRGYGKSEGEASEEGLYLDSEAVLDYQEMKLRPMCRLPLNFALYSRFINNPPLFFLTQDLRSYGQLVLIKREFFMSHTFILGSSLSGIAPASHPKDDEHLDLVRGYKHLIPLNISGPAALLPLVEGALALLCWGCPLVVQDQLLVPNWLQADCSVALPGEQLKAKNFYSRTRSGVACQKGKSVHSQKEAVAAGVQGGREICFTVIDLETRTVTKELYYTEESARSLIEDNFHLRTANWGDHGNH
eukprot:bmy_17986T0